MKLTVTFEFDNLEEATKVLDGMSGNAAEKKKQPAKKNETKTETKVEEGPVVAAGPVVDIDFTNLGGPANEPAEDSLDSFLGGGAPPAAEKKILTREELRQKAANIAGRNDAAKKAVIALIKKSGVTDLTQLPEDKFVSFNSELDKIK